jgi:FMN-dependent NADH-azoreductase
VGTMFSDNDDKLQLSNQMIDELFASDVLVIESPMYNFRIPSVLKAWIDHVVRARKTSKHAGACRATSALTASLRDGRAAPGCPA